MSDENLYWKVGKVLGSQGVKGEIFVLIFSQEAAWLSKLDQALLGDLDANESGSVGATEESFESFQVLAKRVHHKQGKMGLVLKLEGLNDRDVADSRLKGKSLYIPDEFLWSKKGETPYLREVLGFKLESSKGEVLGEVLGFGSNGVQDLLEVVWSKGKSSVPFIDSWVVSLDRSAQRLVMDLPEGLLEETLEESIDEST